MHSELIYFVQDAKNVKVTEFETFGFFDVVKIYHKFFDVGYIRLCLVK